MAIGQINEVVQHLRQAALRQSGAGLTDGQLLECFLNCREEAAVAALVKRHGPMVWGVCRRVLSNHHDAEDAFQATFLVLLRKASSIVSREKVANWLYGVAHQTALKARATAAKRKERERQVAEMPEPVAAEQELWRDLQPVLDEELSRLPDKYRGVIVLCDLEGKTRKEAARQLGCPEGTVAGRLTRARRMLAKRLARRGLAVSGGTLAAALTQNAASAGMPVSVMSSTIAAASVWAAGQAALGVISIKVAALTEGVLKAMLLSKLKNVLASVLLVAVLAGGAGLICATRGGERADGPALAQDDKPPSVEKPNTDMQRLQGTWKLVETHKHGKKVDAKEIPTKPHVLVIDGSKVAMHYTPKGEPTRGKVELKTTATPKELTITWAIPSWQAIYRLEEDRLTICFNPDNGIAPDEFRTTADSGRVLYVYQRVKEADKDKAVREAVAPDKGEAKIKTRWEYKSLSYREIKELEFRKRGTDTADGGLNMLGEEGWELVAIEPPERGPTSPFNDRPALYVFKRQKK